MKYFIKHYYLLIIAQTACLALGLWLEYRFVNSLVPSDPQHNKSVSASVNDETVESVSEADAALASNGGMKRELSEFAVRATALVWIAALQTIVAFLVLMRDQDKASCKHRKAERISLQQYYKLLRTRDAVIFGLAKLAESRDPETGNHLERIAIYSTRLANALRCDSRYRCQVTSSFVKLIGISSALHDIGKVGIRDAILLKPGRLERQERSEMQLHAEIGGKCVREIESRLGKSNFLHMAREIAFCHHEHWDGKGYPKGLAGEEIPLAARIVAIADVYDALASKRIYKEAYPHERCVETIREEAGRQFDPVLVETFLKLESEFREIARSCRDAPEARNPKMASAGGISDIAAVTEMSIEDKFSVIQTALDQCDDDPPLATISPREAYDSSAASLRPYQHPVSFVPLNDPFEIELEPENVS
jgi:HD-GYP domain-containing protein (c-di-GMP phosphodiesterase class II)